MTKKLLYILSLILLILQNNYAFSDDSYIRRGINAVMYQDFPGYMQKEEGTRIKNIVLNKWSYIYDTLNEILSWDNIPYFGIIHEKVEGDLVHKAKVKRQDAGKIGWGAEQYAKGDR